MQGKTLSLLCSSLTWLTDERERARKGQFSQQATQSSSKVYSMLRCLGGCISSVALITAPAWVSSQSAQIRQRELEAQDREYEERLAKARKVEARLRALGNARVTKRQVWRFTVEFMASDIGG